MDPQLLVQEIDRIMPSAPFARPGGSLLLMVGLPGSGKSSLVTQLQELLPSFVISTDWVRRHMRQSPTYTAAEMMFVYEVCNQVIGLRLKGGQRVIFDGSNYQAARRERLFKTADRYRAAVAVCHVQAAEAVVRDRLRKRTAGQRRDGDLSDAGWSVYQWMVQAQEPIVESHLTVDTSATAPDVLARQLRDYWLACEEGQVLL